MVKIHIKNSVAAGRRPHRLGHRLRVRPASRDRRIRRRRWWWRSGPTGRERFGPSARLRQRPRQRRDVSVGRGDGPAAGHAAHHRARHPADRGVQGSLGLLELNKFIKKYKYIYFMATYSIYGQKNIISLKK